MPLPPNEERNKALARLNELERWFALARERKVDLFELLAQIRAEYYLAERALSIALEKPQG